MESLSNLSNIKGSVYVRDVMSKNVKSLAKDDTVHDAIEMMSKSSVSCIVIVEDGMPIGILTEKDLLTRVFRDGKDGRKVHIGTVMTKEPKSISPDDPILKAGNAMNRLGVKRLVVTGKDGKLIGIITQTDIIRSINRINQDYRYLLWNPLLYFVLFLIVSLMFILNNIIFN